jgi:hypothetical protein
MSTDTLWCYQFNINPRELRHDINKRQVAPKDLITASADIDGWKLDSIIDENIHVYCYLERELDNH